MKMFKTPFTAAAIAIMFAAAAQFCSPSIAAAADFKVAIVDLRSVAKQHPVYTQWEQDVLKQKAEREKQLEKTIKDRYNLPDDPAQAKLTTDQQQEIQQFLMSENQKFLDEIQPARDQKMQEVEADIMAVVEKLCKEKGYSIALDNAIVLFGGDDITALVLGEIKKNHP